MCRKIRRKRLKTYLKKGSQQELAKIFGKTQPWISQIAKEHPGAMLTLVDGRVSRLEFKVNKVHERVN